MAVTDEFLIDRITKLEEENKELEKKVKKYKLGYFCKEAVCVAIFISTVLGFLLLFGIGHDVGEAGVANDKCSSWCTSRQSLYETPQEYEGCFKQCDNWCD